LLQALHDFADTTLSLWSTKLFALFFVSSPHTHAHICVIGFWRSSYSLYNQTYAYSYAYSYAHKQPCHNSESKVREPTHRDQSVVK
jgi:hypothetical protein